MSKASRPDRAAGESTLEAGAQALHGGCPAEEALAAFGDKWKIRIILTLARHAGGRFLALRRELGNVHQFSLTRSLRELEAAGIVERMPSTSAATRMDYVLTDKGTRLVPILLELDEWQSEPELTPDAALDRLRQAYASQTSGSAAS